MAKSHPSKSYHTLAFDKIENFAQQIRQGMADNPTVFTAPPVTDAQFHTLIDVYVDKYAAYKTGGSAQKPAFEVAYANIMDALDDTNEYVDDLADGVVTIIEMSNFTATKTDDTPAAAPAIPVNVTAERGVSTELFTDCPKVEHAQFYGCVVVAGSPLPPQVTFNLGQFIFRNEEEGPAGPAAVPGPGMVIAAFDVTKKRRKRFFGLAPHVTCYIYYYAGNATGVSALSEPKSIEVL